MTNANASGESKYWTCKTNKQTNKQRTNKKIKECEQQVSKTLLMIQRLHV